MNVKNPSNSDRKNIKAILKENGIINISMKKDEWYIVVHYHPAIVSILLSVGYDLENESDNIIYIYIPRNMKRFK